MANWREEVARRANGHRHQKGIGIISKLAGEARGDRRKHEGEDENDVDLQPNGNSPVGVHCPLLLLAHAIGNVELALHDHDVDFAVWCSYKYLNAGPGAVGGCYLHERHAGRTDLPRFAGWWGNDPATRFAMQTHPRFEPVPRADGWQLSNPPILSFAPLRASLALFDRAGIDALRRKSVRLTGYLEFLLDTLAPQGIEVMTPRDPSRRGAQLSIRTRGRDAQALVRQLEARSVIVDFRDPDVIRAAPAPLYNSFHDVWRFQETLREVLRAIRTLSRGPGSPEA